MPELPEVETVRRILAPHLIHRILQEIHVLNPQIIAFPESHAFQNRLKGQQITDLTRRGKFLRISLKSGDRIVIHLRMTGCLTIEPSGSAMEKHTHLAFLLDDGSELRYEDVRRFGKFWLIGRDEQDLSGEEQLGPDPLNGELTADHLSRDCGKSKKAIKTLLMDQRVLAGIGNIYSDEILFAANIRPDRPSNTLSAPELERLALKIPQILARFTEKNAMTFEEYRIRRGKDYRSQSDLNVYGQAGTPCPVCGTTLQRTVLSGRSTVFCPFCQK